MSNIYNIFSQQRRVGAQLFGEEETDAATDIEQPTVVPYSSKAPLGKSVDDALRDMKLRDAMNTKLGDVGGGTQMPPDNTGNIYDDGNITAIGNAEKPLEEVQNGTNQTATPETTMSKAATTEPSATNAGSSDYQFASPELQNKAEKEWKKLMKDEYAVSKVTDILEKNLEGKDRQNKFVYKTELAKALKEYGVPGMEDKPTSGVYKTSKELTINGKPLEDDSKIGMLPTTKLVIDKWAKENPDAPIPPVTEYTNTMKQTNPNEVVRYNGNDYVTNIQQAQDYVDKLARMRASVNPTDTKVQGLQGINNWDEYQGYLADKAKVEEYNKNLNSAGGQYTGSDLAFQMKKKKLVDEVLLYDSTNGQKGISYDQWNNVQGGENITTADGRLIAMPVSTFSGGGKKGEKMEMPKEVKPVIVDIIGTATAKTVTDDTNRFSNGGGNQRTVTISMSHPQSRNGKGYIDKNAPTNNTPNSAVQSYSGEPSKDEFYTPFRDNLTAMFPDKKFTYDGKPVTNVNEFQVIFSTRASQPGTPEYKFYDKYAELVETYVPATSGNKKYIKDRAADNKKNGMPTTLVFANSSIDKYAKSNYYLVPIKATKIAPEADGTNKTVTWYIPVDSSDPTNFKKHFDMVKNATSNEYSVRADYAYNQRVGRIASETSDELTTGSNPTINKKFKDNITLESAEPIFGATMTQGVINSAINYKKPQNR